MRKRIILLGVLLVMAAMLAGCSNPKRDAVDTHIWEQIQTGTLDCS